VTDEAEWYERTIRDLESRLAWEKRDHRLTLATAALGPMIACFVLGVLAEHPDGWQWPEYLVGSIVLGMGFSIAGFGTAKLGFGLVAFVRQRREERPRRVPLSEIGGRTTDDR
jgi:hypothetical protein